MLPWASYSLLSKKILDGGLCTCPCGLLPLFPSASSLAVWAEPSLPQTSQSVSPRRSSWIKQVMLFDLSLGNFAGLHQEDPQDASKGYNLENQ